MLARVADNLFWLGRYFERADNTARMVEVHRAIASETTEQEELETVLFALDAVEPYRHASEADPHLDPEGFLVRSDTSPFSMRWMIASARTLALELREQLSREVFEELNRLHLTLLRQSQRHSGALLDLVRESVSTVQGMFANTVLRTEGTHWFNMDMYLERADMTSRIMDAKYFVELPAEQGVGSPWDHSQWRSVLRSASGLEAYHKLHRGAIRVEGVVDVLVFAPQFPRGVRFCVGQMEEEFRVATSLTPPLPAPRPRLRS
jgi:uncharacterized alpha-E superfamily protein